MKFTKEIKSKWLEALRSGKYIQGFINLVSKPNDRNNKSGKVEHCCIGVLGEITEGLNNNLNKSKENPYKFLKDNLSENIVNDLYELNDLKYWNKEVSKQDYSNVIPTIEQLQTVD